MRASAWAVVGALAVGCAGKSAAIDPPPAKIGIGNDAGTPVSDAGQPVTAADAGPLSDDAGTGLPIADAGPIGGGDWMQYRHDQRGGSLDDGSFSASDAA